MLEGMSAEPLRSLAGVLDRFEAHKGVVAATGSFTQEAEEERTKYLWQISLRVYDSIVRQSESAEPHSVAAEV